MKKPVGWTHVQSAIQSAYTRSPIWLQNAAISLAGWQIHRQRYQEPFFALLEQAQDATWASPIELHQLQEEQWDAYIRPVLSEISGYSKTSFGLQQLQNQVPLLTKAELRAHLPNYIHPRSNQFQPINAHTSGTTGAGLKFITTAYSIKRQWAYWWRYRSWHGIPFGEWCGIFGGRTIVSPHEEKAPFWRVNAVGKTVMYSQYHITPKHALLMLKDIQRRRLRWLHGYPSLLALLARVGIDSGLAGSIDIQWITIGAENLLENQKILIQKMFGVLPLQHYGLSEAVVNISECPHKRLHVDEDFSFVEFVPRTDGGEGAHIVGTTLDNQAMPLLRYDTGDIAILPKDHNEMCSCGRSGRLVSRIDGRKEDYLVLSDGSLVGRIDHLFKDAVAVSEAQVVQKKKGEAIFRIVQTKHYSTKDEKALLSEVEQRFGDRLSIEFEYVEQLPRSKRGKLRLVINQLKEAQIDSNPPGE